MNFTSNHRKKICAYHWKFMEEFYGNLWRNLLRKHRKKSWSSLLWGICKGMLAIPVEESRTNFWIFLDSHWDSLHELYYELLLKFPDIPVFFMKFFVNFFEIPSSNFSRNAYRSSRWFSCHKQFEGIGWLLRKSRAIFIWATIFCHRGALVTLKLMFCKYLRTLITWKDGGFGKIVQGLSLF